jgi:hypothetical protein
MSRILAFVVGWVGVACLTASAEPPLPPLPPLGRAELSGAMREAESRVRSVDAEIAVDEWQQGPDGQLAPTSRWRQWRWAFEVPYGRNIHMEETAAKAWVGGLQDTAYVRSVQTFDGEFSRTVWWFGQTEEDLSAAEPSGNVRAGLDPGLRWCAGAFGLVMPWRYGWSLSDVVEREEGVTVEPSALPGSMVPCYRVYVPAKPGDDERAQDASYYVDPKRGFAVVRWERLRPLDRSSVVAYVDCLDVQEIGPGIWLPTEIWYDESPEWYKNPEHTHYLVTSVRVNVPAEPGFFAVDFPAGTFVTDFRTGHTYTVGENAPEMDDLMRAQSSAARDAVKAVARGEVPQLPAMSDAELHRSPEPEPVGPVRGSSWRRLLETGLGGLIGLAGILVLLRERRTRLRWAAGPALAGVGLALLILAAGAANRNLRASTPGPALVGSRPVRDCGRYALCFAASYWNTGWTPERLAERTPPEGGLSLLALRDLLRQTGLRADGIRVTSLARLRELVRDGRASVVLATTSGDNAVGHFFCVVAATTTSFVVVDPPRPVGLATEGTIAAAMKRGNGYALVIRPPSNT